MEELKQKYQEIKNMADRLEELRLELYQNKEHKEYVMDDESEFEYVDNKMFSLQSQLRDLAEFCFIGVIDQSIVIMHKVTVVSLCILYAKR